MNKPFVFVLMPFAEEFNNIYELGIKAACNSDGIDMYCERVDKQIFEERILDRIYNQINKADYIIADLSGKNPNVFYETGYAHALNKRVILLISDSKEIQFDLRHHPHIIYEQKIDTLKEELTKRLKWHKENPSRIASPNFEILKFYIDGHSIENGKQIEPNFRVKGKEYHFSIDVCNISDFIFAENCEVCLEVNTSEFEKGDRGMQLPNNMSGVQYSGGSIKKLFPKSWFKIDFVLMATKMIRQQIIPCKLKIYTEVDTISTPFQINLEYTPSGLRIIN